MTIEFLVTAQQMLHEMTRSCVPMLVRWLWMECVLCKTNDIFHFIISATEATLAPAAQYPFMGRNPFPLFCLFHYPDRKLSWLQSHKIGITVQGWIHFRGGHYEGFVSWFCLLRAVCVSFWSSEEQLETALAMMQNLRRRISLRSR